MKELEYIRKMIGKKTDARMEYLHAISDESGISIRTIYKIAKFADYQPSMNTIMCLHGAIKHMQASVK